MTASLTRDLTNYENFTYKEAMAISFTLDSTSSTNFPYNGVTTISLPGILPKNCKLKKKLFCILTNICK